MQEDLGILHMNEAVKVSDIASYLDLKFYGHDINIRSLGDLLDNSENALKFIATIRGLELSEINKQPKCLFIVPQELEGRLFVPHIISSDPKTDFCRVADRFFASIHSPGIETSAHVDLSAQLGDGVYVGHNVIIGRGVRIGDFTQILGNCVISGDTTIGSNCIIRSGTIIGQRGFGFRKEKNGIPIAFPHVGKVRIGNNVEIGALNTIAIGSLSETAIDDFVKTDDHVHIAHNVKIGRGTFITACVEISGSVKIGSNVWIGPNASIINGIFIGDDAYIGIGAVVTKSVPSETRVAGNPAKTLGINTGG